MIHLDVRADIRGAQVFLRDLSQQGTKRATARALNRTAITVRAEAARLLKKKRDLPIGQIKGAMRIRRATTRFLQSSVVVSGKPISIRHFARHGKRGVTVRIEQGGKRTQLRRFGNKAFINPKWRPGVFVRRGKSRLPIQAWAPVPGLPTVLVQNNIVAAIRGVVGVTFKKRIAEEMRYEIRRAAARR